MQLPHGNKATVSRIPLMELKGRFTWNMRFSALDTEAAHRVFGCGGRWVGYSWALKPDAVSRNWAVFPSA